MQLRGYSDALNTVRDMQKSRTAPLNRGDRPAREGHKVGMSPPAFWLTR